MPKSHHGSLPKPGTIWMWYLCWLENLGVTVLTYLESVPCRRLLYYLRFLYTFQWVYITISKQASCLSNNNFIYFSSVGLPRVLLLVEVVSHQYFSLSNSFMIMILLLYLLISWFNYSYWNKCKNTVYDYAYVYSFRSNFHPFQWLFYCKIIDLYIDFINLLI